MNEKPSSELELLWQQYSKEDLWNHINEWWQSANRSRIIMLLAMHHAEELSVPFILEKVGDAKDILAEVLSELESHGQLECVEGTPKRYKIRDESAFLQYMQKCCERTSVASSLLSTLAGWAGKSE